ncbi:unnamed protein product [Acanthosepion pharaonis]|uniref:Reverse transcriptase domain-containing protein n=1 Tax=Acanthosepion pharaonis TaxID=158019 RepID=A0A812DZG3_ACAPH|nr:unnamed protein product [Sepia pharaonis]
MSSEAVNLGADLRREEVRRGGDRYIREVKSPEGRTLQATDDMCGAFRRHFENRFTKEPGLQLKILAKILQERLQSVAKSLLGPEQTCSVRGRTIQSNLHLIRTIIEGVKDDEEAALINLDQSKAFDRIDHRYLAAVLQAAGFAPNFCRWISLLYRSPSAVEQVNGRLSDAFVLFRSVRQGCPLSPLLYALALEPLLRRLKDETGSPALRGIAVPGGSRARVSAYADDVSAVVSATTLRRYRRRLIGTRRPARRRSNARYPPFYGGDAGTGSTDESALNVRVMGDWECRTCRVTSVPLASDYLSNPEFSLSWRLARNRLPLNDKAFIWGLADLPDCERCGLGLEETAAHAFYHCPQVRPLWDHVGELTARLAPEQLVSIDRAYACDNVSPPYSGMKRMVFLTLMATARMVIWTTRKEEILRGNRLPHSDLNRFFEHQLKMKIRSDRKRLHSTVSSERWVKEASLLRVNGASLDFLF